jgi:hypothetical protein
MDVSIKKIWKCVDFWKMEVRWNLDEFCGFVGNQWRVK